MIDDLCVNCFSCISSSTLFFRLGLCINCSYERSRCMFGPSTVEKKHVDTSEVGRWLTRATKEGRTIFRNTSIQTKMGYSEECRWMDVCQSARQSVSVPHRLWMDWMIHMLIFSWNIYGIVRDRGVYMCMHMFGVARKERT
jgi:hypothetical protein